MTTDQKLKAIRDIVQHDIGERGLKKNPTDNLITATLYDFAEACKSFAGVKRPSVGIVTGFLIPTAEPPRGETDGPLGTLFLARALHEMGIRVVLITDNFCVPALRAGLVACGLAKDIEIFELPREDDLDYVEDFKARVGLLTHLISIERVGPSHNVDSIGHQMEGTSFTKDRFKEEVPPAHHDRYHTMRGRDITDLMAPGHRLFQKEPIQMAEISIGIGDGGNEIGMGKIAWDTIRKNIENGAMIACRVPTDYLIVAGISNWGAYALAAGIGLVRGQNLSADLFDINKEKQLLQQMVEKGPLVDGKTAEATATVDGVPFGDYILALSKIREIVDDRSA
jgi:D-glutamate cyclase